MGGDYLDAKTMERRVFALFRMARDPMTGRVSRAAPSVAAQAVIVEGQVDDGSLRRAMSGEIRNLQAELATLDLSKALVMEGEDDDGDEGASGEEPNATRPAGWQRAAT